MNLKKIMKKVQAKHIYSLVMFVLFSYLVFKSFYVCVFKNGIYGCRNELTLLIVLAFIIYVVSFIKLDIFNVKQVKEKRKINIGKEFFFKSIFLSLIITTFIYLLIAFNVIYIDFYRFIPKFPILSIIGLAFIIFILVFVLSFIISFMIYNKFKKK